MKSEPLGDSALILRDLAHPADLVAHAIEDAKIPGLIEAVASYDTVGVYFDGDVFEPRRLDQLRINPTESQGATHEIPVCYEMGLDLDMVAAQLELSLQEVIRLHTSRSYHCFAVGFCPGFPYLGRLPDRLCGIARRTSPRLRVDAGSVAITRDQTGIYPLEGPGGWAIIGKTPLCLVDPDDSYFPISAGDEVRFVAVDAAEFAVRQGDRL